MFSFGQSPQSYAQLESARAQGQKHGAGAAAEPGPGAGNGSQPGRPWKHAEADVEAGQPAGSGGGASGPSIGGDSGRVQVPIGMVADSSVMRRWQVAALVGFSAVQVALFLGICILGLVLNGWGRVAVVALGGGAWLALLLFNMRMAGRPRPVIQSFLHAKRKTKLAPAVKKGSVVVVRGAVSLLHEELLSTEFHNVPGLVLVESSLRSYHPGMRKTDAWTEHVRQTRAVDFRITDALTGTSAVVRAFQAAESGEATPLVHISTEVPLSTAIPVGPSERSGGAGAGGPRVVETEQSRRKRLATTPQLMVCKGYIRQGQVITVMGELTEVQGSPELFISALSKPHNISKFLLYRHFLPFFFPTWISGLVISDQRDLA